MTLARMKAQFLSLKMKYRCYGILLNPCSETILKAIECCQLHPDLANFFIAAKKYFRGYIKIVANPKPIFVTYEDEKLYNDVSNLNIPKLKCFIN